MSFLENLFGDSLVGQTTYDWGTGNPSSQSLTNIANITDSWEDQARDQLELMGYGGDADRLLEAADRGVGGDIDPLGTVDYLNRIRESQETSSRPVSVTQPSVTQPLNTTKMYRFQNESQPGTYLFAGEGEAASIRRNFTNFKEEGLAFQVSVDSNDPLLQGFYRFRNTAPGREGTYLFVGEQEANSIRQNYNNFVDEGLAFYAYGGGTGGGTVDFARFQSNSVPGTYIFTGPGETAAVMNNPNFTYEGTAFAAFG